MLRAFQWAVPDGHLEAHPYRSPTLTAAVMTEHRVTETLGTVAAGWTDRPHDHRIRRSNLLGDLASMDVDMTRKLERQPNPFTFDRGDLHYAVGVRGIHNDHILNFAYGN